MRSFKISETATWFKEDEHKPTVTIPEFTKERSSCSRAIKGACPLGLIPQTVGIWWGQYQISKIVTIFVYSVNLSFTISYSTKNSQ